MATPAPSSQETTLGNTSNNAQNFPRFHEFSAEIRLLIWKEVLRDEQEDRAVIFDKHSMRILPTPRLVSPLLAACSESRHEALKVYNTCLDVYDMPLSLPQGGLCTKDESIPESMVREHGRRSGKVRVSLSTDTFVLDGGYDGLFCLRRSMERRYYFWDDWEDCRTKFGPKYGYPYERAVSARLSEDRVSQVRKTLWIIYACWWKVPGCLCPCNVRKHVEDLQSVVELLSGRGVPRHDSLNGPPDGRFGLQQSPAMACLGTSVPSVGTATQGLYLNRRLQGYLFGLTPALRAATIYDRECRSPESYEGGPIDTI